MRREINLNSKEWRDLIFEGKNKKYGAYYLRATSDKRHIRALILVIVVAVILLFLPTMFRFVGGLLPAPDVVDESVTTVEFLEKPQDEEEIPERQEIEIPQQELLNEIAYVVPKIADVAPPEEEQRQIIDDLKADDRAVGHRNVDDGINDPIPPEFDDLLPTEPTTPQKPVIHTFVSEMPTFPGGNDALMRFLRDNLVYPRADLEMGVSGTVPVRFTVTPTGQLTDIKVMRSVSPGLDAEALRVVRKMERWNPGRQNGQAVYVQFDLPVRFVIQSGN